MNDDQNSSRKASKRCATRNCTFNDDFPNGIPDKYETCSICQVKLAFVQEEPNTTTSVPNYDVDSAVKSSSIHLIHATPPISEIQPSELRVIFRTIMIKKHFLSIYGKLTIRFHGLILGNFMDDNACLKQTGETKYEGMNFVILEGFVMIPEELFKIANTTVEFGLPYKYFLNGKEEHINQFVKCFRCLFLNTGQIKNIIYQYDFMVISDTNLMNEHSFLLEGNNLWRITFNIFVNMTQSEKFFAFEEQVSTFKTISGNIFRMHVIPRKTDNKIGIVSFDNCKRAVPLLNYENECRANWIESRIKASDSPQAFLKIFIFLLLLVHKKKLNTSYEQVLKQLLKLISLDDILELISKQYFFYDHFQDGQQSIQHLQSSFETIIFKTPQISDNKIVIKFLPLYHSLFKLSIQFDLLHENQEWLTSEYWGFPSNIETSSFYSFQNVNNFELLLDKFNQYDPILPYSIVLVSMNDNNFPKLSTNPFIPIVSYLPALVYRTKNWCLDHSPISLRCQIFSFLFSKLNREPRSITITQLHQICDAVFFLWEIHLPEDPNSTDDGFLHLNLTATILHMLVDNNPNILSSEPIRSDQLPLRYFKFSEELLNIFLQTFNLLIILQDFGLIKIKAKLKLWAALFSIEFPESYNWDSVVESRFKLMIQEFDMLITLEIFTHLSTDCQFQTKIYSIFKERIIEFLKIKLDHASQETILMNLVKLPKSAHSELIEVLNIIYFQQRESFDENPAIHILSWSPWHVLFDFNLPEIQGNNQEIVQLVHSAQHEFINICKSLNQMRIQVKILRILYKAKTRFLTIHNILSGKNKEDQLLMSVFNIKKVIDKVLEILAYFDMQTNFISNFNSILNFATHLLESQEIKDFLLIDFESQPLNEICSINSGGDFRILPNSVLAKDLNTPHVQIMLTTSFDLKNSNIFLNSFKALVSSNYYFAQIKILEMKDIYDEIWQPTFLKCEVLINTLLKRETSLILVDKHFSIFRDAEEKMRSEIKYLSSAIFQVSGHDQLSVNDINSSARVLIKYFKFQETCELASLIHKVHIEYCQEGDFRQIDILVNLKNFQFTKENNLKIITNELENLTLQLSQYDHFTISLISSFVSHPHFIKWARDTLIDRQQMKVFIDLALTSCGESDFNINRITCLRSVCFHLAPLIFDMRPKCDYKQFLNLLDNVIEQIGEREKFLNTFNEAANLLHLWRHMELTHSSVGKSTIQELTDILKFGYIEIQFDTVNNNNTIQLYIPDSINRVYSLEGLKDLKSKITLIKAETKTTQDIELFFSIFEKLMDLYSLVGKLINLGHMSYVNYFKKFTCNSQALSIFSKEIELGNKELGIWSDTLDHARREFYSLNFFTNVQILLLRRDLKLFQSTDILNPQIFHLLSLLNPNITMEIVSSEMHNVHYSLPISNISQGAVDDIVMHKPGDNLSFERFPSNFSEDDKQLCISLFQEQEIDIDLSIIGIKQFKRDLKEYDELELTEFCLNNSGLIESVFNEIEDDDRVELCTELNIPVNENAQYFDECHLSLKELSIFLEGIRINCPKVHRNLPNTCKPGHPNLVFIPNDTIFYFALSQYLLCDGEQSLPSAQEIILCEDDTKLEEIDIFFKRAVWDTDSNYLFSLLFVERLKYDVAVQSIALLKRYMSSVNNTKYKLLLLCSAEFENTSYFASAIYKYKRIAPTFLDDEILKDILFKRFTFQEGCRLNNESQLQPAWLIDQQKSKVRILASHSVGAGKSLAINDLVTELRQLNGLDKNSNCLYTIPLHGGKVIESDIVTKLISYEIGERVTPYLFHFDVASTIMDEVIPFLFKLLILGNLRDRFGKLWSSKSTDYYIIEITLADETSTLTRFCELFPITLCLQPKPALEKMRENKLCSEKTLNNNQFISPLFQRVYVYLHKKELKQNLEDFTYTVMSLPYGNPVQFMEIVLKYCGLENPSWSELSCFIYFLGYQLYSCEQNIYYQTALLEDDWKGFRTFLINMIIPMSRDIATPSLSKSLDDSSYDLLGGYSIESRRRWEHKNLPYLYLNEDRQSMTFFGINISKSQTLLDPFDSSKVLEKKFISKSLYSILTRNLVNFQDDCYKWDKAKKISVLANVIGIENISKLIGQQNAIQDPDPSYVLTIDNLKKILAIHMRFRCNIPVIIMGETGCGKTRLVYYMCQLQSQYVGIVNMRVLKIHGGTTCLDITRELTESIKLAKENVKYNIDTVLFFDEANTSQSIGLIKEILCDKRINGNPIPNNIRLQFVVACNPYRRHSNEMLIKLMSAGLGKVTMHREIIEKFGKIPLRELVYRVVELPKSLLPLVWDFGQLSKDVEESYIREIIRRHLDKSPIKLVPNLLKRITEILTVTQEYMRYRTDECSFVSLRDVERTMKVMLWFFEKIPILFIDYSLDRISASLLLSLSVCYRARLKYRRTYDVKLVDCFKSPLSTLQDEYVIIDEIEKFHSVIADSMKIGEHIAKNSSLKENLFMMFVCIELKIPLFIIGKPGSSKSLAKAIINNSMEGEVSPQESKLKHFKQVEMLSYQCSQLSTSEGILNLFQTCKLIQSREDPDKFVSCVVLEEVGLAEDSPLLPLKVLHPLLDDDPAYIGNLESQSESGNSKIAFIGLSNWALDPAKMNRGIMVCLEEPHQEELILSANAICESNIAESIHMPKLVPFIKGLVSGYLKLIQIQREKVELQYFGLRDFYSLIKMLYNICKEEDTPLNATILRHAVKRNFGGLEGLDPFKIFSKYLYLSKENAKGPLCTPLELINANLISHQGSFYARNRYLLLLTENYAALDIIRQAKLLNINNLRIIFGSSFPNDSEYSTICRNINLIKNYIETGKTVILTNLLNLYESLYDVLNQYYFESLGKFWVDIGLGTHRVKCSVDPDFKLIVIADYKTVYEHFPSALINRFEKHTLTVASVLTEEQNEMAADLTLWAEKFSKIDVSECMMNFYPVGDCIVGYQEDTTSRIIYSLLNKSQEQTAEQLAKTSIMDKSKIKLIKMSTPDSILRLSKTKLRAESNTLLNTYLSLPLQDLKLYFEHILTFLDFFSIVTTHSMLLSESEVYDFEQSLLKSTFIVSLQVLYLLQFQTNQQFSNLIDELLNIKLPKEGNYIILLQCEDANLHSDLIAFARHHIIEQFYRMQHSKTCNVFFVIVVRMSCKANCLSSYCGDVWETVHIDELRPPDLTILPSFTDLINLSLSEIFSGTIKVKELYPRLITFNQGARLLSTVQPAFSLLFEQKGSQIRTLKRINQFISLLHDSDFVDISAKICAIISDLLDNKSAPVYSKEWSRFAAFEEHLIFSAGTFRKALSKEIDKALIPLVAVTLSFLDRNGNIDLIFLHDKPAIQEIWRCIFLDQHCFFNHSQLLTILSSERKRCVPVISDGLNGKFFQSCFPFSWLIVHKINEIMNKMKTHSGVSEIWVEFEEAFEKTIIGELISSVNVQFQDNTVAFNYLDDFISLVIFPKDIIEHKIHYLIILNGVLNLKQLIKKQGFTSSPEGIAPQGNSGKMSLSIPMIHIVYEMLINRLNFIKQSFSLQFSRKKEVRKQIELSIDSDPDGKLGNDIDAIIFEAIVSDCLPNMDIILTNTDWEIWVLKVRKCQPIIESNLEIIILDQEKRRCLRSQWNSIQAILIFVTNFVLLSDYDMKASLRQFYRMVCTKDSNFQSAKTLQRIFAVLNALTRKTCIDISHRLNITCFKCNKPPPDAIALSCLHFRCRTCAPRISPDAKCTDCAENIYAAVIASEREIFKNNCREMLEKQIEFRKRSTDFIMEILSAITFSGFGNETDEVDLIEYLVGYVTLDQSVLEILPESQVEDISLFQEGILKPSPTVRLFLLQILIKNRFHSLRNTLSGYMDQTFSQLQLKQENTAHEKLVLFVQCFEDYYHSQLFSLSTEILRIQYVSSFCLTDRRLEHFEPLYKNELSLAYVESISLLRFIVLTTCQWLIDKLDLKREILNLFIDQDEAFQRIEQKKAQLGIHFKKLIELYQELSQSVKCSDYLNLFFLKTLYSQMGWGGIKSILCNEELEWILPTKYIQMFNFDGQLDLFASFGQCYQNARKAIHCLITQADKQNLVQYLNEQKRQKANRIKIHRDILFAVFTEIFIRNLSNEHHNLFSYQIQSFLITIENEILNIPNELLDLIHQLLSNRLFNGHIPELVLSPKSHGYTSTIAGLLCHIGVLLHHALNSAKENLLSPLTLIYLEPKKLYQRLFPTMKNMDSSVSSIKMAISENGRWYECPSGHSYFIGECGKPWTVYTCPECGVTIGGNFHTLHHGNLEQQRYTGHILGLPSERYHSLSGIRRLSATSVAVIRALMHGIFIWASGIKYHLDPTELIALTEHVGNMHPSQFYFLHMIFDIHDISNISGKDFEESALVVHLIIDRILNCQENFVTIDAVLTSNVLRETWEFFFDKYFISPILSDIDSLLHEKLSYVRNDVGLSKHSILRSIYEKDTDLSQPEGYLWRFRSKIDFQHFSKTFNSQGLEKSVSFPLLAKFIQEEHLLTATKFLPAIVKLQSKLAQKNYKFTKNIPSHRSIQFFLKKLEGDEGESAMEDFKYLINEFASAWKIIGSEVIKRKGLNIQFTEINFNETPLQFILPISKPSSIIIALTELLVDIHNLFITEQKKYSMIQEKEKKLDDTIYISQLSNYNLINYQPHLDKLILSNARYSLKFGEGTVVKYDYSTIERQLVDNFIRSKPYILWDLSKPGLNSNNVDQIMFERIEELIPQEELDEALAKRIVTELQNIGNISEVLDLVEVVIGFAGSAGGFQDHKIKSYLHDVLKYPEGEHLQSDTANASCFMKHLVWLWKNLSVVRAILFVKHNQHPFASLPEHFYTQLNLEQNRKFKSNLNLLSIQELLFALHDFVFFFLRNLDSAQAQYPLYDCYSEYFKLKHSEEPEFFPAKIFTVDILVSHTIHVWTILAQESEPW